MGIRNVVQRQFGPVAAEYAASVVHASGPDLAVLVDVAAAAGAQRALDVGCGAGHTALAIAPHVASVVALDLAEAMLDQARHLAVERGVTNMAFQSGDAEHLPFPDESFDLVTSRYAAHHFPRPAVALREIARVLRPGGILLLVDVVAPPEPLLDTHLNTIELLRDPSHVRDHPVDEWRRMLASAGLYAELLGEWPLRLAFAPWIARMHTPPERAALIRAIFESAPGEVRAGLAIEPDGSFSVPTALLRGSKPLEPRLEEA